MSLLRPRTVGARLARAYALAVTVALLLYAAVVLVSLRSALLEQLDVRLEEDYESAEHGFDVAPDGTLRWSTEPRGEERPSEAPFAEILDPAGRVLLARPDAAGDRREHRVRTFPFEHEGTAYVARVGRSESGVRREVRETALLLGLAVVPMVLLAGLAGLWLARRLLAPVREMTQRARAIGAEDLAARLPVHNPQDELGRLALAFNGLFARLEDAFERLRRFTADASHELRTPLSAMKSVGEVALTGDGDAREAVSSMLEECERLGRLVDDLLTLSRAEAGAHDVTLAELDLLDLARRSVADVSVLAEERGQTVVLEGDGPVLVRADARWVRLAVMNVLHNAVRYAPEGTTITVAARRQAEEAVVEIHDQGPGIAPGDQARIFERFVRLDPARHGAGAGLGLSIARWAVEACGGRITLDSAPGTGSTFHIRLPASSGGPLDG